MKNFPFLTHPLYCLVNALNLVPVPLEAAHHPVLNILVVIELHIILMLVQKQDEALLYLPPNAS